MMTFNNAQVVDGNRLTTNNLLSFQMSVHSGTSSQENYHSIKQLLNLNEGPLIIFTPCSNSHPFEERRISVSQSEEQATKIGRAVIRSQSTSNNAMFDCKVLSRNHAIMWYKDKKFYIKDTRSSNGTFLNNERLSNSGEESTPHVLLSGDILQFGIEIFDNTKKVASGCITCIVSLINEYGKEYNCPATESNDSLSFLNRANENGPVLNNSIEIEKLLIENETFSLKYTLVPNDKIFIMDQYLKEARFRENLLGQKLKLLEEQLTTSQEALQTSWQALINEEHLLSRIELLESQLVLYTANTKNSNKKKIKKDTEASSLLNNSNDNIREEEIRVEIQEIHEDCVKSEFAAKDALRKTEEQMFETNMRLHDAENGLLNLEEENAFLRQQCQDFESELSCRRVEIDELICELGKQRTESVELQNELGKNQIDYNLINDELQQRQNEYDILFNNLKLLEKKHLNELKENRNNKKTENKKEHFSENKNHTENNDCSISTSSQLLNNKNNENASTINVNSIIENNENINVAKQTTKVYSNGSKKSFFNECNNLVTHSLIENEGAVTFGKKNVPSVSFISDDHIDQRRCSCGRKLLSNNTDKQKSSALNIQVLLFSTLPLAIAFFTLLLPLFSLLSSNILTKKDVASIDAIVCDSSPFETKTNYKSESASNAKCKNT